MSIWNQVTDFVSGLAQGMSSQLPVNPSAVEQANIAAALQADQAKKTVMMIVLIGGGIILFKTLSKR